MDGSQLMQVWITAGGTPGWAALMAGIALAESGGTPGAVQQGQPYATTGWGLWQITPGNSEPQAGIDTQLLTAHRNASAAVAKYGSQGLTAWRGDRTWLAWQNAGAPTKPTATKVSEYVRSWGGNFGTVQAPPTTPSNVTQGRPPVFTTTPASSWERLRTYANKSFNQQMAQWDSLINQAHNL